MLAPLLAGMTMADPTDRFTAKSAIQFFHNRRAELTSEELSAPLQFNPDKIDILDPWHGLHDEFVARWTRYRSPPPSLLAQLLRYICQYTWCHDLVVHVRLSVAWVRLSSVQRLVRRLASNIPQSFLINMT